MPNVRYLMSFSKQYNFDKDILETITTSANFNLKGDSLDVLEYQLPWAEKNLPWLNENNFFFQSYNIVPNRDTRADLFLSWSETYTKSSGLTDLDGVFEVQETINLPAWRIRFFYDNNVNLGQGFDIPTNSRLRQTFGLTPVKGSFSARSFSPFSEDPYSFINKNFATFDGVITSAQITETVEGGRKVYDLSISWNGGKLGTADVPAYTI